jgi:transposase-like protein
MAMATSVEEWTGEDKIRAVLPVMRGDVTRRDQATKLMVPEQLLQKWQEQVSDAVLEATSRLW